MVWFTGCQAEPNAIIWVSEHFTNSYKSIELLDPFQGKPRMSHLGFEAGKLLAK